MSTPSRRDSNKTASGKPGAVHNPHLLPFRLTSFERRQPPRELRKNSLFAGSDKGGENWACMASLIETCKLNDVNPQTYMTELLTRLVNGWPQDRIEELMPWCWKTQPDT